jgi:hypothetical protein
VFHYNPKRKRGLGCLAYASGYEALARSLFFFKLFDFEKTRNPKDSSATDPSGKAPKPLPEVRKKRHRIGETGYIGRERENPAKIPGENRVR